MPNHGRSPGKAPQLPVILPEDFVNSRSSARAVCNRDLRYETVNEKYAQLLGMSPEALIGRNVEDFQPELAGTLQHACREALRANQAVHDVHFSARKPAQASPPEDYLLDVQPLQTVDGQVAYLGLTVHPAQDSATHEGAAPAAQLEAQYRLLIESVMDYAIFILDPSGHIVTWNKGAQRNKGYTAQEIIGRHFSVFYTEEDRAKSHPDEELRIARQRGRYEEEGWRVRKDGTLFWANVVITALHDEYGTLVGFGKVTRDLTERREAELRLRQQAEVLAELYRFGQAIATELDLKKLVQTVTDTGASLSGAHFGAFYPAHTDQNDRLSPGYVLYTGGLTPGEAPLLQCAAVLGSAPGHQSVIRSDDITQDPRFAGKAAHCGLPLSGPPLRSYLALPVISRTGERLGVLIFGQRDLNAFGEREEQLTLGLASQAANAIENAQLYEHLRESHELLEQRVSARTSQLSALNEDLEAFSYSVSHDLRTPVRHILAFSGALADMIDDHPKAAQYLKFIQEAGTRMNGLIDGLLDHARLGSQELRTRSVDLNGLIDDVRYALAPDAGDRKVGWQIEPLPPVRGDPELLKVVLANLLSNALKYTRLQQEALIQVSARETPDEVIVQVQDNGVGFDPKYASRVFGVFQRLHTEREFEGSGVGLSTVRRLVERHGGRIWADAQPGKGATFSFSLPRSEHA